MPIALHDKLKELESIWRRTLPGYVDRLAPPATPEELAEVVTWFGPMPADLVDWLTWHNGARSDDAAFTVLGATRGLMLLSSSDACVVAEGRASTRREFEGTGFYEWNDRWFPLLKRSGGDVVVLDCTRDDGVHPLHYFAFDGELWPEVVPDLSTAVDFWVELHESGVYGVRDGAWTTKEDAPLASRYPLIT